MRPRHIESLVDDFGQIVSEVSIDNISPTFAPLVDAACESIPETVGDELSSLYLYGSIPAARAVAGRSDLDLLAVLQSEPGRRCRRRIEGVERELEARFPKRVREVSIAVTWIDELFHGDRSLGWKVFIRHLCVLLWGDDIAAELPKYRPTPEVCANLNGDAPRVLADFWRQFEVADSEEEHRRIGGMIARKILRTGMSVVSAQSGEWATSRADIASYLILYFPEIASDIELLLHLAEEQELALVGNVARLRALSQWAVRQAERELVPHLQDTGL